MNTKGTGSRTDWSVTHAAHINNGNECASSEVVHPAGLYDHSSYEEYLSWYVHERGPPYLVNQYHGAIDHTTRTVPATYMF